MARWTTYAVVYVAGPYRAATAWEIEQNIRRAETLALEVWRSGAAAVCPHANTRFFQGAAPDDVWLDGDLAILAKCDALLMSPDWTRSSGSRAEQQFAEGRGIPVFYGLADLRVWLAIRNRDRFEPTQDDRSGANVIPTRTSDDLLSTFGKREIEVAAAIIANKAVTAGRWVSVTSSDFTDSFATSGFMMLKAYGWLVAGESDGTWIVTAAFIARVSKAVASPLIPLI